MTKSAGPPVLNPHARPIACAALTLLLLAAACTVGHAPKSFYICGAVRKPGRYTIKPWERVTILKALEISGGLREMADGEHCQIIRRENGSMTYIDVNLTELFGDKSLDVELLAGDTLFVPDLRNPLNPFLPHHYDTPPQGILPRTSAVALSNLVRQGDWL